MYRTLSQVWTCVKYVIIGCVASSDGERSVGKTEAPDPAQKHKQTEQKNRPVAVWFDCG